MTTELDYWRECISIAAEECDLVLSDKQLACLAESAQGGHENYGMAFYSPPWTERMQEIEDGHKAKLRRLEAEFAAYRTNAETAVKKALRQYNDAQVTIGKHGEVLLHGGRTERIQ